MAGAEKVVLAGVAALRAAGSPVTLAVLDERRRPEVAAAFVAEARRRGIEPCVIPVRGRLDPLALFALRRLLASPALLHVHGYKALAYGLGARRRGLPVVATDHGRTAHAARVRIYEAVATRLYGAVERVVAVSEAGRRALVELGVPPQRVVVVPNLLAEEWPAPPGRKRRREGQLSLLALGRLSPEKGLDVLLQALTRPEAAKATLVVVGDGPVRDALERAADAAALSSRVRFAGFQGDVAPFLAAADALVMPSYREGMPMALIEAVVTGVPVVASAVGGVPELVADGVNGRLVPPGDAGALAAALGALATGFDRYADGAWQAAEAARRAFSPATWAAATADLYRSLLAREC